MNRHLLLILLTSWSLLVTYSDECDTGVAFPNNVLSVTRSSLANADVALLKSYVAETVIKCMEDCCSGKYGSCSVASFKKNTTKSNCLHFYCRPLKQCKFLSSPTTDSFTFSSDPYASHPVPSSLAANTSTLPPTTTPNAKSHLEQFHAVEEIATYSEEQTNLKNDNKSVKPRKGVTAFTPDALLSKSGIKPRKGVTIEDVPHSKYLFSASSKSNVKPRKGVAAYLSNEVSKQAEKHSDDISANSTTDTFFTNHNFSDDFFSSDLDSELARVLEDDPLATIDYSSTIAATTSSKAYLINPTPSHIYSTSSVELGASSRIDPSFGTSFSTVLQESSSISSTTLLPSSSVSSSEVKMSATAVVPSSGGSSLTSPLASTVPLLSAKAHLSMEEPKSFNKPLEVSEEELENSKKYTSSIHLILSLVFGLIVLFAVLGVVAKRMYDGWQRRDYYRMNYLIDGIYNGYD